MEHIAALLLIIGCSGESTDCRELPAPVPFYEAYEDCQDALNPAKAMFKGAKEHVYATCVLVDPAMEEEDAELVWDITRDGRLVASVEPVNVMVASNKHEAGQPALSQD